MNYYRNIWDVTEEVGELSLLPGANAIVPLNPVYAPAYFVGSMMGCNNMNLADRGMVPFHNFGFAMDFISSAPTQKEYAERMEDTATVNLMCAEGAFASGAFINAKVEQYLRTMEQSFFQEFDVHEELEITLNSKSSGHRSESCRCVYPR